MKSSCVRINVQRGLEAVDDMAQEVFLVAFRQLGQFQAAAPFQSWVLGIARNQALSFLRGEARRGFEVVAGMRTPRDGDTLLDEVERLARDRGQPADEPQAPARLVIPTPEI